MKYITIATDVSCDSKHRISTWACYIRHNGGAIKKAGQFKNYYMNTAAAETYALVNALTIAHQLPSWSESKIIIHNEIEHVLTPVTTKTGNIKKTDLERAQAIKSIALPILSEAMGWERRKIKAHYRDWKTSDNPAKYAINRWCDMEARKMMKYIRSVRKKELKKHLHFK